MSPRTRKAWRIDIGHDDTDVVYAETRSKAIYWLYVKMDTSMSFGAFLKRAKATRAAANDIVLPPPHPLASGIDPRILHCVTHAFGGTGSKAGYRDHFYTSERDPIPKAAYYHGLFEMHRVPRSYAGSRDMVSYILTDLGRNVARGEAQTYPAF